MPPVEFRRHGIKRHVKPRVFLFWYALAMISRLGLAISRAFYRICPDPFVIAILLTVLTAILAMVYGSYPPEKSDMLKRSEALLDWWRADTGLWKLLAFSMQMCLVLVTGYALAATKPVRHMIQSIAGWPRSTASAAVLVCIIACLTGLLNWGLGLIVGALLALEVGRSLTKRGIAVHYPLLAAAGYMGLLVFHGGFSGSAPLTATTVAGARRLLPESAIALLGNGISLDRTLFSPLNLFVTGGLIVLLPLLFWRLAPRQPAEMHRFVEPHRAALAQAAVLPDESCPTLPGAGPAGGFSLPDLLDRSALIVWLVAAPLLLALVRYVQVNGILSVQLNEINVLMLALGLILHGSPRAYMNAVEHGARDCAAIIIQFPIYAGIMAMMQDSGMAARVTAKFTAIGDAHTLPALSFAAATLVGLFVPSGGAQWGLQGPIALQSGAAAGVDPAAMLMSVAYGDEVANMLQPFWALPLLAITGVRARDIVGYTAIAMAVAWIWMALGLLLF